MDKVNDKFILDPFIYYELKKSNEIDSFSSCEVAQYRKKTREDVIHDNNFIQKKHKYYIPIIRERLNKIQGRKFDKQFWEKALSVPFERYITFIYDVYANCEANFDPKIHQCNILSLKSFRTPISFDKQRDLFQHSHIGKEQIFSLYIRFHDFLYNKEVEIVSNENYKKKNNWLSSTLLKFKRLDYSILKREILKKWYYTKNHTVGIHGSLFSNEDLNKMMVKSRGKIYPLDWYIDFNYNTDSNWADERSYLSSYKSNFDKFDRFFFYTMNYLFPREFIENFSTVLEYYIRLYNQNISLKYITSEAWPSVSTLSIGLAYLKTMGVKHIYNEHNYFAHPYVCSELLRVIKIVDIFTSLGWYDKKYPNMIASNSLFDFKIKKNKLPDYDICYITTAKCINMAQIGASDTFAENALKYYKFVKLFFSELSDKTVESIFFRGYPKNISANWLQYDDSYMLQPYYDKMKKIDPDKESGRQSIAKSKLVIVDYLSTPHLQSLLSDIPTVFFHNKETYYLNEDYSDFFNPLIDCGICHTDPKYAAQFVERIKENVDEWWYSNSVRKNRKLFMEKSLSDNNHLQNYLISLSQFNR